MPCMLQGLSSSLRPQLPLLRWRPIQARQWLVLPRLPVGVQLLVVFEERRHVRRWLRRLGRRRRRRDTAAQAAGVLMISA